MFRIEERPSNRTVAANKLNEQSQTGDEGWSSRLEVGRRANRLSLQNSTVRKHSQSECLLWRQNSPEIIYSRIQIAVVECFQGKHRAAGKDG